MEHSTAAKVWAHLETLGCEQVASTRPSRDGQMVHRVEIRHQGAAVAIEEHTSLSIATSRAILDAVQLVVPPRPALPFALMPALPVRR